MIRIQFALCTAVILYSGFRLSLHGDGISSAASFSLPNAAAGDLLGGSMLNSLILVILDIRRHASPVSALAHRGHVVTGAFGILLPSLVAMPILAADLAPAAGNFPGGNQFILAILAIGDVAFRPGGEAQ